MWCLVQKHNRILRCFCSFLGTDSTLPFRKFYQMQIMMKPDGDQSVYNLVGLGFMCTYLQSVAHAASCASKEANHKYYLFKKKHCRLCTILNFTRLVLKWLHLTFLFIYSIYKGLKNRSCYNLNIWFWITATTNLVAFLSFIHFRVMFLTQILWL